MTLRDLGFDFRSNRFVLFDRLGRKLNENRVAELPNYLDLEVLDKVKSSYTSMAYFVGFETLHIKVDIENDELLGYSGGLKFGQSESDYSH